MLYLFIGGVMVMKIKTIYEIFNDYTEREIDFAISQLSYDERLILRLVS